MQFTSIRVPYVNLARQHAPLRDRLLEAVAGVLGHGRFILGEEVEEFENRFAGLCKVPFAVAVHSGTDALILALRSLGIGPGDEVITVPNSFISTVSSIRMAGARPVLVDVREDLNMDPARIERAITSRTRAILPVHLTGRPADMDPILEVARTNNLAVVEDCAQAVTAEYRGRPVGSLGEIGCFSLHPLKTLGGCGDGGILTTGDEELFQRIRLLRNVGLQDRDRCLTWSSNSRLDSIQAAMLMVKMDYLEKWTGGRRANASRYRDLLGATPGLKVPGERPMERAVYHTFVIQAERRDDLKRHLRERGVETAIHYPVPIHLQEVAAGLGYGEGSFPLAEEQARSVLSLPVYPELEREELEYVAGAVQEFYRS